MDWEHNRQELFDTGLSVFNLDHDVVENIKKLNINFQEKVNNNIITLSVQMNSKLFRSNTQLFNDIHDKFVEMNKIISHTGMTGHYFPKDEIFDFAGNYYNHLIKVREFLIKRCGDERLSTYFPDALSWPESRHKELINQMWYYTPITDIDKDAFLWKKLKDTYLKLYDGKVTEKTVDKTYQQVTNKTNAQIQLYDEGCFIFKHSDGSPTDHYQCQMLLYIDEDWKPGMGGELFCINSKGKEIVVEPKIGTCVVLDYDKNPEHEVKVVKEKNYLRNVIRCDWIVDSSKKN